MIETRKLSKSYGAVEALRDVTFTAAPGRVTGSLGLNGSGKTTTLRLLLGLGRPTKGDARINGRRYRELRRPLREVGAVLEQGVAHPGLTGRGHLRTQAPLAGASPAKIKDLLEYVGVVIIAGGEVRLAAPLAELAGEPRLRVRCGDPRTLWEAFGRVGASQDVADDGVTLLVAGLTPEQAGDIALAVQVPIYELTVQTVSLEEVFFELAGAR